MMKKGNRIRLHKHCSAYIKDHGLEYTQAELQHNIAEYGVYVEETLVTKRLEWVPLFCNIDISHWPTREKGNFESIDIVFEDEDTILINKPYNVVVEPGAGHIKDNLQTYFHDTYGYTPFLVHRLDKNTQGLLLLAKNEEAHTFYQDQFRNRSVLKSYLARVYGKCEVSDEITHWQSRDMRNPLRQKLFFNNKEGYNYSKEVRECRTSIIPYVYNSEYNETILNIALHTGRMHQIRVLCEALKHPLVADHVYNTVSHISIPQHSRHSSIHDYNKDQYDTLMTTIFKGSTFGLISNSLEFTLYSGERKQYTLFSLTD